MNETLGKWHFWLTTIWSSTPPSFRCISWANGVCRGASTPTRRTWAGISGTSSRASVHSALGIAFLLFFANIAWSWLQRRACRRRSVGCAHARMVDTFATARSTTSSRCQLFIRATPSGSRSMAMSRRLACGEAGQRRVPISAEPEEEVAANSHPGAVALPDHHGGRYLPRGHGHAGRMVPAGLSRSGLAGFLRDLDVLRVQRTGAKTTLIKYTKASSKLDNRKVGVWSFIGSECVFFASLISTFMVYKSRSIGLARRRHSEYSADLLQHVHPADVELADGAGACRLPGGKPKVGVPSGSSAPHSSA